MIDEPQRARITTEGLGETLFVEAGAGTGKTTQLVGRVKNLVLKQGVALADIAAITFTEAAAAELVDRIRVAFERELADTSDPVVAEACRAAVADADRAAITTLHGFARRVLAAHPLAAGLPPRVGVLDEINSELAHEARWERFIDDLYEDPDNEAVLERAALLKIALEPAYEGHATFKDVSVVLAQNWDLLGPVAEADHGPLRPVDFTAFDRAAAAVVALPERCTDHDDLFYVHLTTRILPSVVPITSLGPDRKLVALKASEGWGPGNGGKPGAWDGDVKAAKQLVKDLDDARKDVLDTASDDVLVRILTLVAREVREAAESRRAEGNLEFHDLLVLARRLLREDEDARRALHRRYTHLLLDEFQDTDPIQVELAVLIASALSGRPPDWHEISVDPGRLFFVGDPKQSIYRFRRADIALFLQARERFGPGGTWLRLTTNFRTVPDVLNWVNQIFDQVMPREEPGRQPRYEALHPHREGAPGVDHRPVLLGGPMDLNAADLRDAEAGDVAAAISNIRARPDGWPVWDEDLGQWRGAALRDITVLVPTRTSLPQLRAALDGAGIPYRLNTGTLVYDTQEVRDALAALRAVDDPTDELSLVAALRSPLYACSDRDLFTWRDAGGKWDVRPGPLPDGVAEDHPVALALGHLRSLWDERWWVGPSTLLDRLLRERDAVLIAFAAQGTVGAPRGDSRAAEVWGRLRFLVDQARAFEEAGGSTLRGFVEWAELQRSESARVHEPLLPETDDDAVRIMTIHGAKGLEFPITVVSGLTTQPGAFRSGVRVLWGDDETPAVSLRKGQVTANYDPRADLETEMDVHEKLRLLYVACTRARDHLIVSAYHKVNKEAYGRTVHDFSQAAPDTWRRLPATTALPAPAVPAAVAPSPVPVADGDREAWAAAREALLAPQRRSRVTSATAIARERALDGVPDEDRDEDEEAGPLPPRRRGRAGTAVGRAVHATLQFSDFAQPDGLSEQAARQAALEAIPDLAEMVADMARSAIESDAVALAASYPHHKELFVAAPVGDRVIEGYVDLLIETPEGLVIVDYKTDTVRSEAEIDGKLAAYELQGAAYAVALETSTGMHVAGCRFVFCRPGGAVEREVADLPGAKARVRAFLAEPAPELS